MPIQHSKLHLARWDINMGLHNQNMHIKWLDDDLLRESTQELTSEQREKEKEKESVVVTTHDKQLMHIHDKKKCKHFPSHALATSLTRKSDKNFLAILIGTECHKGLLSRYKAAYTWIWRWCQKRNVVKGKITCVSVASPLVSPLLSSLPSHPLHASPPLLYLSIHPNYSFTLPTFTRYE